MKKLLVFTLSLLLMFSVLSVISFAEGEPVISASGVSIRIPEGETKGGLRFKMTVEKPLPEGIEIIEEGTLILPLYAVGGNYIVPGYKPTGYVLDEITLDTENALKVTKTKNKYYTYTDTYYEFTAVLTGIPVYNLKSDICARGYIKYTVGGEEKVVYSDTVIYDIHSIAEKMVASSTESTEDKNAVESFILDAHENYFKTDGGNAEGLLTITAPTNGEVVYPYYREAKTYVVDETLKRSWSVIDSVVPVEIKWTNSYPNVASYTVLYATKSDFSDAKYAYASANATSVGLYNLYKATTYYVKVIANLKDGTTRSVTSTFDMHEKGPRVMHLDGSYNMRDLGGYMTESGKRTLQGLIFRSGQFDSSFKPNYPKEYISTAISDYGKHIALNELGLKTELDFRSGYEAAIPGANRLEVTLSAYYLAAAANQERIREIFSILANVDNYPIVFHCQGGADRTGTVAYLFNALLGVPEADIIRDYEFTTFSLYGVRTIDSIDYIAKEKYAFFTTLNAQEGDTLQKRVENYLLSIGVTAAEIANIKSIMFTGDVERTFAVSEKAAKFSNTPITITIGARPDQIKEVSLNGVKVNYVMNDSTITIPFENIPSTVESGSVNVKVVLTTGKEFTGVCNYDGAEVVPIE
ncbi:MAG: tyrosine-protein phosphatase, partial [Clostridia bacterium]|nr:tyrosine-protein phosphatase [Clostridia bacterium]